MMMMLRAGRQAYLGESATDMPSKLGVLVCVYVCVYNALSAVNFELEWFTRTPTLHLLNGWC